jgi:acyl-CoA synthetase (NDP forming)
MTLASLDALFRPRSVAVVGASSDANKVGGRPIAFLRRAGYTGRIIPVNPGATEIQGLPAVSSLSQIDGTVDQAILAVPAARVLGAIEECTALGVKAVQIFSAGFGEGADAARQKASLCEHAQTAGLRVLGPNSLGLFNTADAYFGTFATALDGAWPRPGGIGVATQSGAFGSYFFGMAHQRGLGFSHFVATGNEWDVDLADCVAYLASDPGTSLIVVAMEGCRDGRKFAAALRAARLADKRVLAMKVGVSAAGARAATTHTGALSGADKVFDAVLRDCGVFRAHSLQELVDTAYVASVGPLPRGRRLLIVTTSGGIGVLSADAAEQARLELPVLQDSAVAAIREIAPLADGHNPVDTSAGILSDLSVYARIAERALDSAPCDAVLCYVAHIARNPAHWTQLRAPLLALRQRHADKTFALVGLADAVITADLEQHGFAVFIDPSQAVHALAGCAPPVSTVHDLDSLLSALHSPTTAPARTIRAPWSTEHEAKAVLASEGIAFAPERFVENADTAVEAANALGWPVVLKIVSPDLQHKTEVGGVELGIADEQTLRAALPAMRERVRVHRPAARIDGFIVARQLRGGVEVLLGTHDDPVFGPVITVGVGGVLAELVAEVCVRLAPVSHAEAVAMLRDNRLSRLLEGFRGAQAADIVALARQIVVLSELAWANRTHIAGIELNPVLALPSGTFALDALITGKETAS